MVDEPLDSQTSQPPKLPTSQPPVDLHATSDIRFVMLELGKLTTQIGRLIDDVKSHSDKISGLEKTIARYTTAIIVGLTVAGAFLTLIWWAIGEQIKSGILSALQNIPSQ